MIFTKSRQRCLMINDVMNRFRFASVEHGAWSRHWKEGQISEGHLRHHRARFWTGSPDTSGACD